MGELFFDQDDDEVSPWEDEAVVEQRRGGCGRWLALVAVVFVIAVVGVAAAGMWVNGRINPSGGQGDDVALTIPNGSTAQDIGARLAEEGIISDEQVWRWYLRWKGTDGFLAGDYTFRENSSMDEAVAVLDDGPALADFANVTIPEGLTLGEVAGAVSDAGFLDGGRFLDLAASGEYRSDYQPAGVANLEGLLFPETYRLEEGEDEVVLLTRMVETLDATARELGYDDAQARTGRSAYEVLIIASLIEAEARVDEDRAKISRVIYNRLAEPMSLGIDATVYYALGRRGGSLTRSDLDVDSPYNTRKFAGLPPTPIAIPGRASLDAALNPEPGPWLYYVLADESGVHAFSEGYDEFLANVASAREKGLL